METPGAWPEQDAALRERVPVNETLPPREATGPRVPLPPHKPLAVVDGDQIMRIELDTWPISKGYRVPRQPQPQPQPQLQLPSRPQSSGTAPLSRLSSFLRS